MRCSLAQPASCFNTPHANAFLSHSADACSQQVLSCLRLTSAPLIVVQPALSRPDTPSAVKALLMTSPQKGATSADQSVVFTPG